MHTFTQPGAPSLLRLIIELRGSDLPSNNVFLGTISEREPETMAHELEELVHVGLITWSEIAEQWTPTMRGLLIGMGLPAFEPGEPSASETCAECA